MRRLTAALATTAALAAVAVLPAASSADPSERVCPSDFLPVAAIFVGNAHDHNNNGIVCRRFQVTADGIDFQGGPDDKLDDLNYIDDVS